MNDDWLTRYSRHILLDAVDVAGQRAISDARVLVVGAGGLGSSALLYLAASGVGHLTIIDGDTVSLANLQRQIVHRQADIDHNKAESAADNLRRLNPEISITPISRYLDTATDIDPQYQVVVDCSDNFATRYRLNRACRQHRIPLVSGAAIRFEGLLAVFDFRHDNSPCYECLFPATPHITEDDTCSRNGVFSPLVGMIGTAQASETLKLLMGIGQTMHSRLASLDMLTLRWHESRLIRDPACPVCANHSTTVHSATT